MSERTGFQQDSVRCDVNVFKASSRRQKNLLVQRLRNQKTATATVVSAVVGFLREELRENSLRFFFASIMT
jgi:hypothetical protein